IADSNETSEPFSCPLVCVTEINNGRVCCIGSYEMFRDKIGGGFQCSDHSSFALNIFKWLVSDYRMELRSTSEVPIPVSQEKMMISTEEVQPEITDSSVPSEKRSITIDFSMKISKKSELFELLKIFQNQINTIKTTIDKLIETSAESDEDITEITPMGISQPQRDDLDIQVSEPEPSKPPKINSKHFGIGDIELTSLPPKPESLIKEEPEEISDSALKPVPKLKTKSKTKKELKNERKGLETKLSSVQNLLEFIGKKHSSGKIDDDEFSKRTKKLQNDIKKTKKKINVLDKLLD
ncbi:MAG: hypothetical protein KAX18_11285, partial [Candidatus Lokiarchaeota archaeon]|nr:hypothetical protein [Candidatus Lokiarchaeota archaeon]